MTNKTPKQADEEKEPPLPLRYNEWVFPTADNREPARWLLIYRDKPRSRPGTVTIGYGYKGGDQEVTLDAATATVFARAVLAVLKQNSDEEWEQ